MYTTTIIAKTDLIDDAGQKCFSKGKSYEVQTDSPIIYAHTLMDKKTINDNREPHYLGNWYKEFTILEEEENEPA